MHLVRSTTLAFLAAVAVASPAPELLRRAKCADAYYSVWLSNSVSASAFCSTFVTIPPIVVKTTVLSSTTVTSTIKTITAAGLNPTQVVTTTAASTTYTAITTATATTTASSGQPPQKRSIAAKTEAYFNLLGKRENGLPDFVASVQSSQASSACSCILPTSTVTSTISKVSTSVVRVTGTTYTASAITSVVTTTVPATTLTSTTTVAACQTTAPIKNGDFEVGNSMCSPNPNFPSGGFSIASTAGGWPCLGAYCGLLRATNNAPASGYNIPSNICVGKTYSMTASFRAVDNKPDPNIQCYGYIVIIQKSDYSIVDQHVYGAVPYDNQYHTVSGTWTANRSDVYFSVQGYCNLAASGTPWSLAVDNFVITVPNAV